MKSSGIGLLFIGSYLITDSVFLLIIGLFRYSLFIVISFFVGCMFLEIYLFLLAVPICWHMIVEMIFFIYDTLYVHGISCNISFRTNFIYLSLLSLSPSLSLLVSLAIGFSIFVILKTTLFY